jgi:hypothetical protein
MPTGSPCSSPTGKPCSNASSAARLFHCLFRDERDDGIHLRIHSLDLLEALLHDLASPEFSSTNARGQLRRCQDADFRNYHER